MFYAALHLMKFHFNMLQLSNPSRMDGVFYSNTQPHQSLPTQSEWPSMPPLVLLTAKLVNFKKLQ